MKQKFFKPFALGCALATLALQGLLLINYGLTFDFRLVILVLLLLTNSNHQVIFQSSRFSINFPLLFPIIAFFGSAWASLCATFGLVSLDEFEDSPPVFLFNRGSLGIATAYSALMFLKLGGASNLALSLTVSALTYTAINLVLFSFAKWLQGSESNNLSSILETFKTILPSTALAALFYISYFYLDIFGLIGAYLVFFTFRSGALFGHIEAKYRVSLIRSILRAVYAKDQDLMAHLENVAHYTKILAKRHGYPVWKMTLLDEASYFHDIGKLEIEDSILKKPTELTEAEYRIIRCHPQKGLQFLEEIPIPDSHKKIVENIAGYHHENFDGSGYPNGLSGTDIPLEARIVAVADTWDAMVGKRCYRQPLSHPDAVEELRRVKGTQLDPTLVEEFIEVISKDRPTQSKPVNPTFVTSVGG